MNAVRFTKMEGLGNDYVYVDLFHQSVPDPDRLARRLADRHFGVGGDGLILIGPSATADVRMRIFNADGSEAEMCGNGVRCVAKYVADRGIVKASPIRVETIAGILSIGVERGRSGRVERARVEMGIPRLSRREIPMAGPAGERAIDIETQAAGSRLRLTAVSMGNPHAVVYVPAVRDYPVAEVGGALERLALFPERVNVEFVEIVGRAEVRQRTWERGSGETLACGTGASAVCVAGVLTGRTDRKILVHLAGGDLEIEWREDGGVSMTGPAREVFSGEWVDDPPLG